MNERPGLLVTKCLFTGDQNQMSWWGNYFDPHFAFESPLIYWSFYLSECPTKRDLGKGRPVVRTKALLKSTLLSTETLAPSQRRNL